MTWLTSERSKASRMMSQGPLIRSGSARVYVSPDFAQMEVKFAAIAVHQGSAAAAQQHPAQARGVFVRLQVADQRQGIDGLAGAVADLQVQVGEAGAALAAEGDDLAPAHRHRPGRNEVAEVFFATAGLLAGDEVLQVGAEFFQVPVQRSIAVGVPQEQAAPVIALGHIEPLDHPVGHGQDRETGPLQGADVDAGVEMAGAEFLECRADAVMDGQRPDILFFIHLAGKAEENEDR